MLRFTELLVFTSCFPSFLYCLSGIEDGNSSEKCEYPVVHSAFFENPGFIESHLNFVNSNKNSSSLMEFPYQFIVMNCTAPYPIEWVTNIPQHYYYSYILDDEVRTVSDKILDSKSQQKFTVRLHIGNETLANQPFTSAVCQEISNNYYQLEIESCGETVVSIQRSDKNGKAFIQVKFETVSKGTNDSLRSDGESLMMQQEQRVSQSETNSQKSQTQGQVEDVLICTNESSTYLQTWASNYFQPQCSLKENSSSVQIQFNVSELTLPRGALRCNSKNNDSAETMIPYFVSLPQLCPQEDSTLPHLYLQGINPIKEEEFLSICITNVNNTDDIYVGDTLNVTCTSSLYYFSLGMRIYGISKSNNTQQEENTFISETSVEYANGPKGYRKLSTNFRINSDALHGLECQAPVRKSTRWVSKKMRFKTKSPIHLSFVGGSDSVPILSSSSENDDKKYKFLLCNATGDPLPTLSWSRLYNGIMPSNENNTFYLSLDTPTQSWIASKLYLPNENNNSRHSHNLSEYYGRYICTARNKFESLEKIFIFENSLLNSSSSLNIPNLVGMGTVITIAICAVIIIGVLMTLKIQQQSRKLRLFTKAEIDDFLFGKPELLLDDSDSYENVNCYATYLPYNRSQFEIQRENLEFDIKDVLGSGAYGTVYKGILKGDFEGQTSPVAIKTVDPSSDKMYFTALLSEVKMMCYVGKHENIVNFIGACTQFLELREIYVAMEYCENGDLLSYLDKNRTQFEAGYKKAMLAFFGLETAPAPAKAPTSSATSTNKKPLPNGYCRFNYGNPSRRQLVAWGLQIANGMVFLSSKKVIHGDLAARNILLTSDLKPKIGDFGLSTQLYNYANYVRKGDDLVPWRWLAIECLQYMKFSIKSDVWAFGVVLYEIFSIGQIPYPASSYSDEFVFSLIQGERLKRPIYATNKVYELMLSCWKYNPDDRPTFLSLQNTLNSWMGEPIENLIFVDNSYANLKKKEIPFEIDGTLKQKRVDEAPTKVSNKVMSDVTSAQVIYKPAQSNENQEFRGYVDWNAM